MRKLTQKVAQVRESTPQNPYQRGYGTCPINIKYSSSHEDFDDEDGRPRRLSHRRDGLRDLKVEASEFDGNLNPENYLDWIQALERIFELKDYNVEKAFKLAILKMKEYALLWYEHLKKKIRNQDLIQAQELYGQEISTSFLQTRTPTQDHLSQSIESEGRKVY